MPIDLDAMTAAVSGGIAEANGSNPPPSNDQAGDDSGSDHSASADDSSSGAGEGGSPDDSDDRSASAGGDGEPAGGEAADEATVGADAPEGDGAAAEDDAGGETAPGAAKAPGDKGAEGAKHGEAGSGKAPDPLNDPLPNALKKETKERFKAVIGMVHQQTARADRAEAERDEMLGYIRETQATPEQYGQALTYLKLVNSPNRADKEAALQIMQQEVAALARMIGVPVPGVNMLEGHDDLIAEVGAGRLSMERAAELAAARESRNFQLRQNEANQQQTRETQALTQARLAARNQLNVLEQQWLANDPAYKAKRPILIAQMRPIFARIHPSQWAATFKNAYDALPATVVTPPTPRPTPPNVPRNTPIGGKNPAGGADPAPRTMAEAIELGLKQAR